MGGDIFVNDVKAGSWDGVLVDRDRVGRGFFSVCDAESAELQVSGRVGGRAGGWASGWVGGWVGGCCGLAHLVRSGECVGSVDPYSCEIRRPHQPPQEVSVKFCDSRGRPRLQALRQGE